MGRFKMTTTELWLSICSLEGSTFTTTGRGSRPGVNFSFQISREGGRGGRHYNGESIPGYGNELWIIVNGQKRAKSISRSTVDKAYETVLEKQRAGEKISGPKSINVYGASYIWPVFVRIGVITAPDASAPSDPQQVGADAQTAGEG